MRRLNPILQYLLECRYQVNKLMEQSALPILRALAPEERALLRLGGEAESSAGRSLKFNTGKIEQIGRAHV